MTVRWVRGAELPILEVWWRNPQKQLIDFSGGVSEWEVRIGKADADDTTQPYLTKTSGIVGAAGSGNSTTGTPNVTVTWAANDLVIPPGTWVLQITATYVGGLDRVMQTLIGIDPDV